MKYFTECLMKRFNVAYKGYKGLSSYDLQFQIFFTFWMCRSDCLAMYDFHMSFSYECIDWTNHVGDVFKLFNFKFTTVRKKYKLLSKMCHWFSSNAHFWTWETLLPFPSGPHTIPPEHLFLTEPSNFIL